MKLKVELEVEWPGRAAPAWTVGQEFDGTPLFFMGAPMRVTNVEAIEPPIPDDAIGACDSGYLVVRHGDSWAHNDGSFCPGPADIIGTRSKP